MDAITILCSRAAPVEFFDRWIADRSMCIARLTHCEFSHGDYVMQNGDLLGASFNPRAPIVLTNPPGDPCGVARRPWNYQRFAVRRIARIPCTEHQKRKFEHFCLAQLGKPFDSEAIKFKTFLSANFESRKWRNPARWFCYELLARAMEVSGVLERPILSVKNRITGGDFLLIINHLIDVEEFWKSDPEAYRPWPDPPMIKASSPR